MPDRLLIPLSPLQVIFRPIASSSLFGRGSWIRTNDLQYPKLISHVSRSVLQLPHAAKTLYLAALLAPQVS